MASEDERAESSPSPPTEPLGRWERATALAVGIASGGGGGYAVFASANQAGTAILLILAAIFILIGIQGTSLIRFSTGSNTVELERRRHKVEQAVAAAAKEDPQRAAGIIEGAGLALPVLGDFASTQALLFERRLELAILELGYKTSHPALDSDIDLTVTDRTQHAVNIIAKYRNSSPMSSHPLRDIIKRHTRSIVPLLIVINVETFQIVHEVASEAGYPVKVITWRDTADNYTLGTALSEFLVDSPQ
jgi:hypothetical protein